MSNTLAQGKAGWERPVIIILLVALVSLGAWELARWYGTRQSPWLSDIAKKYDPAGDGHIIIPFSCSRFPQLSYGNITFDVNTKNGRWYPVEQNWRPAGWQCPQGPVQQGEPVPTVQPQKK